MPATTGYDYVRARYSYGRGLVPRAIVVHMAEGGGTVGYLSRNPARGVSCHYVVEYSGRVVRMLDEDEIAGTINPSLIRGLLRRIRPDDPPFVGYNGERITYGATAAKAVLGAGWRDPNRYCIAIEIEGFAAAGPNLAQRKALVLLVRDLRKRIPTLAGTVAHRDFQAYKACPGKLIPWANLGGHGPFRD